MSRYSIDLAALIYIKLIFVYTVFIQIVATATINFSLTWVQLLIEGCSYSRAAFINPWRACVRVTVVILCVYHHASCYIPRLYVENTVPLSFLHCFLLVYCVYFTEKALFGSSGDICWSPLPFSILDRISMDKIVSNGFFSRRLVHWSSNRSNNSTGWSLDRVNCQLRWMLTWAKLCTYETHVHKVRHMLCNCV